MNSNINTQDYWDGVYRDEWESGAAQGPGYMRDYELIHDEIIALIPEGSSVLDLACGMGLLCRKIKRRVPGAEVTGVDFSRFAVDRNRERDLALGINYLCLDLRRGPSSLPGPFDVVTMCEILEHLDSPEQVVAEAMGLLRPGGRFILSCPHDGEVPDDEHVREWGHDEVFHLLQPYGKTISFTHFSGTCFQPWMLAWTSVG